MAHYSTNQTRLIARLVREALAGAKFETLADLTDAVKQRGAKLRIRVDGDGISEAYRWVASNTPLVAAAMPAPAVDEPPHAPMLSHEESKRILERYELHLGASGRPLKPRADVALADAPEHFPMLVEVR